MHEVERPLSVNLKEGYHISCPFGVVGRRRVRVVTQGLNLPRYGAYKARRYAGSANVVFKQIIIYFNCF